MQFGTLGMQYKYDLTEKKFQTAFAFLTRGDLAELHEGWIALENGVRASVQHYETMDAATLDFETHEKYFDVQYLVSGIERIGICTRSGLSLKIPYAAADDISFYHEPDASGFVVLHAGDYVVLAPEDAHKPRCRVDAGIPVIKIVVKVPV